MKNYILFLSIIFIAFACSKDEVTSPSTVNYGLVKEALVIQDNRSAIVTFQMLTPLEKALFCQSRLTNILKTQNFSADQVKHITELIKFVKPELYNTKSPLIKAQIQDFSNRWVKEGLKYFSFQQIYYIGFNLSQNDNSFANDNINPNVDCNCCSDCLSQCFFGAVGKCYTKWKCTTQTTGCGIIGTSACDGRCGTDPQGPQG